MFCDAKSNYCSLCLKEKYFIINFPQSDILLNKLSELISKCRHENKNMLPNIKSVRREIMIVWNNIVYYLLIFLLSLLAFKYQENNVTPTMPKDCTRMKLGVA